MNHLARAVLLFTALALPCSAGAKPPRRYSHRHPHAAPVRVSGTTVIFAATCTGAANCRACKNCRYCKHCAKKGGTCGVCRRR